MTIREQTQEIEGKILHPRACLSSRSLGRPRREEESDLRTCFQRDRDRIIHSKSFRRLKHKTQVFLAPRGDHYRTRLTHALEVSQIARTVARALRLNEDLTEAVALSHDLGHTPFGHSGEAVLRELHPGGFEHYEQSLRVVDLLENGGRGLNLTREVRDGIVKHSKGRGDILPGTKEEAAGTLEGQLVRAADSIAYLNHDLDDAIRARVIKSSEIPAPVVKRLGRDGSSRIDGMVRDLIYRTLEAGLERLSMSAEMLGILALLRDFLFDRVYENERAKTEFVKTKKILSDLYAYYLEHTEELFSDIPAERRERDPHRLVCDFIAGMTDSFALMTYERLFLPRQWTVL